MNLVTIIQARTSSSRLPNKVLLPVLGKPVLLRMLERVYASSLKGIVVVATTTNESDDVIYRMCRKEGLLCFRGDPTDLLDRHLMAAKLYHADAVVKIPSDCPLIDPQVIDRVLGYYFSRQDEFDYVSNLHPASYPDGNDVEIISLSALKTASKEARNEYEREHTTPFFWENPDRFRIGNVFWETGLDYSTSHRWTLDYPEDYEFIRSIYESLHRNRSMFSMYDILDLLKTRPELQAINSGYAGTNWYRNHLDHLKTVGPQQTRSNPV